MMTDQRQHRGPVSIVVLVALASLWPVPGRAATPTEIRDSNQQAIVYLHITGAGPNGIPYAVDATGFLVSPDGDILTANHIFTDKNGKVLEKLKVEGWPGTRYHGTFREIEVIDNSVNLDLALLRFKGNSNAYQTVKICPGAKLDVGDALVAVGFPKESELSTLNGILSNKSAQRGMYQTNVAVMEGYSGAPVFEQDGGSTVGIVMGGTANTGRNFFCQSGAQPICSANCRNHLPARRIMRNN